MKRWKDTPPRYFWYGTPVSAIEGLRMIKGLRKAYAPLKSAVVEVLEEYRTFFAGALKRENNR